ncbi:MAG TPA: ASCH domain-containing protein [Phycisphaerae bacterium]|nr:ASCH domain-containing protein [Phycisphaerae bacterium]HUX15348.1 ASCH domain-containing protein [Phycisphaerae bacterium]
MNTRLQTPAELPAITLYQPWATWIAEGLKTIETRPHGRFGSLVGQRIVIHAGKTFDAGASSIAWQCRSGVAAQLAKIGRRSNDYPLGAIVCTAVVKEHRRVRGTDSAAALCRCTYDCFGLFLEAVRRIDPPIPWRGERGIWTVPVSALPPESL